MINNKHERFSGNLPLFLQKKIYATRYTSLFYMLLSKYSILPLLHRLLLHHHLLVQDIEKEEK